MFKKIKYTTKENNCPLPTVHTQRTLDHSTTWCVLGGVY